MKSRLLCLLLTLCMLAALVPTALFPVSAEVLENAGGSVAQSTDDSYEDLYVGSGGATTEKGGVMTVLLSAYPGFSTLNLSEGKWTNAVNASRSASFGGTWTAYKDGGVGYDLASFNYNYTLSMDASLLPTDEYTLEIVASVRGITENADGVTPKAVYATTANISLGRFRAFVWCGTRDNDTRGGNHLSAMFTEKVTDPIDGWSATGSATGHWSNALSAYKNDTSVVSLSIILRDTGTEYIYSFAKNGVNATPTEASSCAKGEEPYVGSFIINRALPGTYYAVRLYTKALTAAELERNLAVDILLASGVSFSVYSGLSEADKADFLSLVVSKGFGTTAAEIEKCVDELEAMRQAEAATRKMSEYDALYIGADGKKTANGGSLTMLLSAYETNSVLLSETGGVWRDKIGSNDASLIGSSWEILVGGGVGYDMTINKENNSLGTHKLDVYLDIGIEALPTDDYSLEYVVRYDYLKEIDKDGNVIGHYNDSYLYTTMNDAIGQLKTIYDRGISTKLGGTHYSRWFISPGAGAWMSGNYLNSQMHGDQSRSDEGIFTQQVVRDLTVKADETTVTYSIYKTGVLSKTGNFTSLGEVSTYEEGKGSTQGYKYYIGEGSETLFYLFRRSPVDVYALRLYDAVLTEYEMNYNHFVDLLAYAKADLSLVKNLDAESKAFLVDAFSKATFADKEALEVALKKTIDLMTSEWTPESSLYVTDGLTVLLSSYDGFSTDARIDEGGVIWSNAVKSGSYGTLVGKGWYRNEDGGLRVRDTLKQADVDAGKAFSFRTRRGEDFYLELSYAMLPEGDYTIETVLSPEGVTVEDENGNISWYFDDTSSYGLYYEQAFILGAFRCMGMASYSHISSGNMERRWLYQTTGGWDKYAPLPERNHVGTDRALGDLKPGQIINYTISHDLLTDDADNLFSRYAVLRDGEKNMVVDIAADMYIAKEDVADKRFNIWRGLASTMYSVRVYDRLLTEQEVLQNRVADICYYFDLDITMLKQALASIPDKTTVFSAFAHLSFDMTKEEAQEALDNATAGIWVRSDGVSVKEDKSNTLRFYFNLQYSSIASIMQAGFSLELGTVVNLGKDALPSLENDAYDYRFVAFDSVSGRNTAYFLDEDTYAVTVSYYDAQRELYNTSVHILAYVKLVSTSGEVTYFYSGLSGSEYNENTTFFRVCKYLATRESVKEKLLTDYLNAIVADSYYNEVVYFDSYAEGKGEGTADSPYTDFNDALAACRDILLDIQAPTSLTLLVEGGVHSVTSTAELDFSDITFPDYTLNIEGNLEAEEAAELTSALEIPASAFEAVEGKEGLYVFAFAPDSKGGFPKFRNLYVDGMTADLSHSSPTTTAYGAFPLVSRFDRDEDGTYLKAQYYYENGLLEAHSPDVEFADCPERTALISSYTKHYEWFLALFDIEKKFKDFRVTAEEFLSLTLADFRTGMSEQYTAAFNEFYPKFCAAKRGTLSVSTIKYSKPVVTDKADRTGVFYVQIEAVEALRETVEARLAALKENGSYEAGKSERIALAGYGLELHAHANWNYNILDVDGVDFDDVVYYYDERHDTVETAVAVYVNMEQYGKFALPSGNTMVDRYIFLRNAIEFVDEEGEYYYDVNNGLLYYYTNYEIEEFTFSYPTLDNLVVFYEAKNLTVQDLTVWGVDDYTLTEIGLAAGQAGNNNLGNKAKKQNDFCRRAAIACYNAKNVLIQDCYLHDIGGAGIFMEGRTEDTVITGNELEMIGDSGIRIRGCYASNNEFSYRSGAEGVTVSQNYLHEIAQSIYNSPAIYLPSAKDVEIANNTIIGCNYTGISIGWSWVKATWEEHDGYNLYNVNIHHNYITDFMQFLSDGGAIYMLGGNLKPENTKQINFIHHNFVVFSDKTGNGLGQHCSGYYFDGSSTNWSSYNNILVEQSAGADRGAKAGADDRDYALYLRRQGSHFFFKQYTVASAYSYNIISTDNFVFNVRATFLKEQQKEAFHMGSESLWQSHGHKVQGTRYYAGSERLAFPSAVKELIEQTGSRMCPGDWTWLLDNEY